jgi:hypothetical protein
MIKNNLVSLDFLINKINTIANLKKEVKKVGYADYPKKYYIIFNDDKKVSFGHQDYEDSLLREYKKEDKKFIEERRQLYRIRHSKESNQQIKTPGFLSYHVLW